MLSDSVFIRDRVQAFSWQRAGQGQLIGNINQSPRQAKQTVGSLKPVPL